MASLLVQKSKLSSEDKLKFKQDIKTSISSGQEAGLRTEAAEEEEEEVQVRFDPHPCIPGLSAKLEVRHEAGRGRHSVAVTDIAPGEAVCEDSPVTWCLSHNHARTHCHHCCRGLAGGAGGYPSPLSRSETVVFCSLACLQEAASSYHRHEAALPLSHIFSIEAGSGTAAAGAGGRGGYDEISGAVMMAVRVITQNTAQFFTSKDWLAGARQSHVPAEVCDDDDREYRYRALFNMVTHHEDRGDVDLLSTTMKSVFILQLLEAMGFCSLRDNLATLGPVIFHFLEVGLYNITYNLLYFYYIIITITAQGHLHFRRLVSATLPSDQLGPAGDCGTFSPSLVSLDEKVVMLSAGDSHTAALSELEIAPASLV